MSIVRRNIRVDILIKARNKPMTRSIILDAVRDAYEQRCFIVGFILKIHDLLDIDPNISIIRNVDVAWSQCSVTIDCDIFILQEGNIIPVDTIVMKNDRTSVNYPGQPKICGIVQEAYPGPSRRLLMRVTKTTSANYETICKFICEPYLTMKPFAILRKVKVDMLVVSIQSTPTSAPANFTLPGEAKIRAECKPIGECGSDADDVLDIFICGNGDIIGRKSELEAPLAEIATELWLKNILFARQVIMNTAELMMAKKEK
jgi:hypothetical protein